MKNNFQHLPSHIHWVPLLEISTNVSLLTLHVKRNELDTKAPSNEGHLVLRCDCISTEDKNCDQSFVENNELLILGFRGSGREHA